MKKDLFFYNYIIVFALVFAMFIPVNAYASTQQIGDTDITKEDFTGKDMLDYDNPDDPVDSHVTTPPDYEYLNEAGQIVEGSIRANYFTNGTARREFSLVARVLDGDPLYITYSLVRNNYRYNLVICGHVAIVYNSYTAWDEDSSGNIFDGPNDVPTSDGVYTQNIEIINSPQDKCLC